MLDYIFWFFVNIVAELSAAFLLGYREKSALASVIAVNLVTHPALHFLLWSISLSGFSVNLPLIIFLECCVAIAEALMLMYALPEMRPLAAMRLSLFMNGASFGLGLLIFSY